VRVIDFAVAGSTPFLVMSYAPNGTLRQCHPKGTRLPLPKIVSYVNQIAEALHYAHEKKLIHRDVKPENMLIGSRGELLLSDFGIALIAQSTRDQSLQDMAGTAAYMAPEQIGGKPRRASDQYALAVVVYEWLCGDRPFHGSFQEICAQHTFATPPSLCAKVPTLPPTVERVVMKALAKDPEDRFVSVLAFARALEQASLLHQPSSSELLTSSDRKNEISGPTDHLTSSPPSHTFATLIAQMTTSVQSIKGNRSRALLALLLALAVVFIGGGGYTYTTIRARDQQVQATIAAAPTETVQAAVAAYSHDSAQYGAMFGFNAQHTRENPYERILTVSNVTQLRQKWIAIAGGAIFSSPAVVNGIVYVGSMDGYLYAYDARTGLHNWVALKASSYGIESSPAVVNGIVYVGSMNGWFYALDALNGQQKWATPTGNAISSSPVVVNGIVYVGSTNHKLYAFDALNGQQKWVVSTGGAIASSPAVAYGMVYISSDDHKLYAFNASNGEQQWAAFTGNTTESSLSSPTVANGMIYVGSEDDNLYAFNALNGHLQWTFFAGHGIRSSPAVANGKVYFAADDGHFYALDALHGQQKWCVLANNGIVIDASPTIANGVVYLGSDKLHAFNAQNGKELWNITFGYSIHSSVAVVNGIVYVSPDHMLYALSLGGQ
jgi:outer membrane protein assembly factor BamB